MANSMDTNLNFGRWAGVGRITGVKQRDFESKRHPSWKRVRERKKRKANSSVDRGDGEKFRDQGRNTSSNGKKKKGPPASGLHLDVIV